MEEENNSSENIDTNTIENVEDVPVKDDVNTQNSIIEEENKNEEENKTKRQKYPPKRIRCELCQKEMLETSFTKHYERCKIKQAKPKIEVRPIRREKTIEKVDVEPVQEQIPVPQAEPKTEQIPPPPQAPTGYITPPTKTPPTSPPPLSRAQKLSLLARRGLP